MIRNRIDRECDGFNYLPATTSSQEWFRKLCNDSKALVILDEVHYLANEAKWGESVKHAFEYAEFVMSLSGTPFRHDETKYHFRSMKTKIKTDYSYNFSNSVKDGLSRPLEFIFSKGRCEWDETGTLKTVNFDDKLNKSDQSKRLRTAIDSELSFSSDLMLQSFEKCMSIRNTTQPNAKMMVIGKDKEHLTKLAKCFIRATNVKEIQVE